MVKVKSFVDQSNQRIAKYEETLKRWATVLPFDQMTLEDYADAFPEQAWNPAKPTWWPHDADSQLEPAKSEEHH